METIQFLGIDISKKYFNFCLLSRERGTVWQGKVMNTTKDIRTFFGRLRKEFNVVFSDLVVCMEHTGIYCNPLLDYLFENNIRTCVESALHIKQSLGMTRGKNDIVDAERIARYAHKNREELKFWKPEREVIQRIKNLLTVRDRLVKMRSQAQVPLMEAKGFTEKRFRVKMAAMCKGTISALTRDILKVEKEIRILIKTDQQVSTMVAYAKSVPGVGEITAINVVIASGEFKRITDVKKFACYAGVAPFEHRSGSSYRGKTRVSKMGNKGIKRLLHLAAMAAVKSKSDIKEFYQRKLAQGKNKMSAINAVRNKLISRIYACIKNERMYQKIYQPQLV